MAIRTDRAGADAIKMPTLLNSKLLIAIINKRFAMISQVPERSAYLRQPTGLVNTFLSLFGEKIIEISNAPILAPNIAAKISLVSNCSFPWRNWSLSLLSPRGQKSKGHT